MKKNMFVAFLLVMCVFILTSCGGNANNADEKDIEHITGSDMVDDNNPIGSPTDTDEKKDDTGSLPDVSKTKEEMDPVRKEAFEKEYSVFIYAPYLWEDVSYNWDAYYNLYIGYYGGYDVFFFGNKATEVSIDGAYAFDGAKIISLQDLLNEGILSEYKKEIEAIIIRDGELADINRPTADEICLDHVLVTLTSEATRQLIEYTPDDFSEIDCASVKDLTSTWTERYRKMLTVTDVIPDEISLDYTRVLCLELTEPGYDNVMKAIEILQSRDDIALAEPDLIIQVDLF